MGWTFYRATCYKNGKVDRLAECRKEFKNEFRFPILKDAMIGTTYYAAIQSPKGYIFPLVVLTSVKNGEFGYKDMEGGMGPYYYDCPESILKLITEKNDNTEAWIAACREKRKSERELNKMFNKAKKEKLLLKVTLPFDCEYPHEIFQKGTVIYLTHYRKSVWCFRNSPWYGMRESTLRNSVGINNIELVEDIFKF